VVAGVRRDGGARPGQRLGVDRGQRFALFSAVRERLAQAAEPDGLLLVLDDIQWADEPSLLLLAHLLRQLRGVRMLILATCREPAPSGDRSGELIRMLQADASTERAALTGLPPVAVRERLAQAAEPDGLLLVLERRSSRGARVSLCDRLTVVECAIPCS